MNDFASHQKIDLEPRGQATPKEREQALMDALRDVELGAYDVRIMHWLLRMMDTSTLRVFCSWLLRARSAGMEERLTVAEHIERRCSAPTDPRDGDPLRHVAGNSGPGLPLPGSSMKLN
jgi:hypothetical protein